MMTSVPPPSPTGTSAEFDYDYESPVPYSIDKTTSPLTINQAGYVALAVINVVIFLLGVLGNGLVIWVIVFKMKKKTMTTTWYLSLAISDFIYCAILPFNIILMVTESWIFGLFMCKFISFVLFLNMFSSIFLMVIISVDRCVTVVFVFWAQSGRTVKRAAVAVVIAWLFSVVLSIPSFVVRDICDVTSDDDKQVIKCYNNYSVLPNSSVSIPVVRFVLGFVVPLAIITVCYPIIIVSLQNQGARITKQFKVMTALIVIFVICWLPYHIFVLLDINNSHQAFITTGTIISGTLASANSCMNPFLYAFMGEEVKKTLWSSFVLKIANSLSEEKKYSQTTSTSQNCVTDIKPTVPEMSCPQAD